MEKRMYMWTCGSFMFAKKLWFANHKLQIRKSRRRFGPKTANPRSAMFEDGHLRIFYLRNLFADRLYLLKGELHIEMLMFTVYV